ncbi:unnamed protein product [Sphagnum troendelagicum]
MVQNEAPKNVKRLASVNVAPCVVREKARSVIIELHNDFAKERKRPSDLQVAISFPFAPYALKGLPSLLSHGTIKQTMLRNLLNVRIADLAVGRDTHDLQPRPHWEALVEGEPYEGAHFSLARVVPYPCNCLLNGCVSQAEALNEGYHARRARVIPGIDVSSLRSVSEKRGVP